MKRIYLTSLLIISIGFSYANNIQLANVSLGGQNTASQFSLINFDLSWENSWRTITNEANYDGAWIFAKFRKKSSNTWQHATLNATGFTAPANSYIKTSADGKGAWLYRNLPGSDFTGNVNYTGAKIQWNYGVDGVLNSDSVEIRVFAAEMVFVTAGTYRLGSGGAEINRFFEGSSNNPYNVASEGTITVANTATNLYYSSNGFGGDLGGPIPANFPKGFNGYWIMKYEASQQQYVDFLNNIDVARANNRYTAGVYIGVHPNLIAPFPERAAGSMNIPDHLAFSDWAGLRPFTELEYEKASRGFNQVATPNEYAWGNTTIVPTSAVTNAGLENETANNGNANYNVGIGRPLRTGTYATATSNRQQSGSTYYGAMEMSGNLYEISVSVGNVAARAFTNVNGDGNLDVNGDANVATWPTVSTGYSLRGGAHNDVEVPLRTSDRNTGIYTAGYATRSALFGIRLARTAE
ncbi:MAG: formylglycine-generating enzyme family protein [Ferruginibacter sp.]|nr:formylglycine-generating enzyme family protein [Ferruginibacter sp.]